MYSRPIARTTALALTLVTVLAFLLAGCGDDDSEAVGAPAPAVPTTIEVTATDFHFGDLPSTVTAGTTLTLVNDAPTELHELVAFRLADDETRTADELMALPPEELGAIFESGPPAMVLLTPPGADQVVAVGDGTLSEPGRYLVICAIPTGADPAEYMEAAAEAEGGPPEVAGGPPHFAHGMYAEVTVEG